MTNINQRSLMGGQYYAGKGGYFGKGRYMSKKAADLQNAYRALSGEGGYEALSERQKALLTQDQFEKDNAAAFAKDAQRQEEEYLRKKEAEELELKAGRLKLAQAQEALNSTRRR